MRILLPFQVCCYTTRVQYLISMILSMCWIKRPLRTVRDGEVKWLLSSQGYPSRAEGKCACFVCSVAMCILYYTMAIESIPFVS